MITENIEAIIKDSRLISTTEVGETIEMIYVHTSPVMLMVYPPRPAPSVVFKIVYSCVNGKWNKSDPIRGTIIPSTSEQYIFE